ncbi:MAG: asparagine synthase (glutamine-hydrolyzing) [Phycisphaerae bacterium]
MCGIAGFVGFDDPALLRSMCAALEHRGPDDEGFFEAAGVGLAMRRLSIIDLESGSQPIANESGDVWVVFNGEIYNYQELTSRLKQQGHLFTTSSDTETIVHLYEEYGLDFAKHLRGMFAIAIWDVKRRRLVLTRDRIGEKPLHYAHNGDRLMFGSEIKVILRSGQSRSVNPQAVCSFLAAGYAPAPDTFFDGIHKLSPGTMLVYEDGRAEVRPYWQRGMQDRSLLTFEEASESFSELLSDTVKLCLKSDVEVGAFLSGGIDSSVLVALMAKHSARVKTFTVGYRGAATGFNELRYASRIAREIGTEHYELILKPQSTIDMLPRILWHFDEPHGEPTSILVYLLCQFARKRVKVTVGGTGGDEIFLGYPRHKAIRLLSYYRWLPQALRSGFVERVVARWPESTKGSRFAKRAKRFVTGADLPPEEAYLSWASLLSREVRAQVVSADIQSLAKDPTGESYLREYLTAEDRGDLFARATDLDVNGYLPEYQLAYMDRMSMAHGLEVRSPLCDYELVDFVTSLSPSHRLKGTHSKHLLKIVARQWIPRSIAERPKVGFDSPIGEWIKSELRQFMVEFLSRENIERSGLLNYEGVQQVLGDHFSGRRDYSLQLWSLLALEAWYRMYLEDGVTDGNTYSLSDMRGASAVATSPHGRIGGNGKGRHLYAPHSGDNKRFITPALGWNRNRLWEKSPRFVRGVLGRAFSVVPQRILFGRRFSRCLDFVEQAQWWSAEESRAHQLKELRHICRIAYDRAGFYRRAFDQVGFDPRALNSVDDLAHLPVIDRSVLREHVNEMCTVPTNSRGVDFVSTGGTGGEPLYFYMGADRSAYEYAYLVSGWRRIGYELDTAIAVFRGRVVPERRDGLRHEYDPLLRHHYYSNFHMSDCNMLRYLDHVRGIGPCFLHVYPSAVAMLARFIRRQRVDPPANVRGIIAESEVVYPEQRRFVEDTFACRYMSCYGQSEKLVAGAECEHSPDYHIWPTYGFFELIDEHGKSVTTPGERGEIVGTGFVNAVMPFIRYRTGDYATYVGDRCDACGREHAIIRDIQGHRTQEILVTANGSQISWTALNMHDRTFMGVRRFQFLQERPGFAILRIVVSKDFGVEDEARILQNLGRKLDGQIEIRMQRCDDIPLSPRGKAVYVDQRISNVT